MRLAQNDNIYEELGDGALLIDLKTGKCWALNEAASALWKLNGVGETIAEFCTRINFQLASCGAPAVRDLGAGAGSRRRPSPRGNSGPG